ncbi:MAG: peptidoglycan-binding protein [Clostridia bacterium]|nr:peptidoglycan-binding protein [Clostridia bacterium]
MKNGRRALAVLLLAAVALTSFAPVVLAEEAVFFYVQDEYATDEPTTELLPDIPPTEEAASLADAPDAAPDTAPEDEPDEQSAGGLAAGQAAELPSISKATAAENEAVIFNYLTRTIGLNTAAACGVISNIAHESGFDPTASGSEWDGTFGYGLCQWNSGYKYGQLVDFCKQNNLNYTTVSAQLQFILYEMQTDKNNVYKKLKAVSNTKAGASEAALIWARDYEVCDSDYYAERQQDAKTIYWIKYGNPNDVDPDDYPVPTSNLHYGISGDSVKWLQVVLYKLGYTIEIDGKFGPGTEAIVRAFQQDNGLTVDGEVGPLTLAKLKDRWAAYKAAHVVDTTPPSGAITVTVSAASAPTVTLTLQDNVGIAGYYFGTNTVYIDNPYTAVAGDRSVQMDVRITKPGIYYLVVKDTSGNVSDAASVKFHNVVLNANGGAVSPSALLVKSGASVTLPTPTRVGYRFLGWGKSASDSDGVTALKVEMSRMYYALWSKKTVKRGDADDNGIVNMADAMLLYRLVMGDVPLSMLADHAVDMDQNGIFNAADAFALYRLVAK